MCFYSLPFNRIVAHYTVLTAHSEMSKSWIASTISSLIYGCVFALFALPISICYIVMHMKLRREIRRLAVAPRTEGKEENWLALPDTKSDTF